MLLSLLFSNYLEELSFNLITAVLLSLLVQNYLEELSCNLIGLRCSFWKACCVAVAAEFKFRGRNVV